MISVIKLKFILILNLLFLVSCVGTIEDSAKKNTDAVIQKSAVLNFLGIDHATAVAHNRIEIYFKPATGGSGNFSYLIYKDGNLMVPVASVSQSELTLDKNGNYSVSVSTGLVIGTRYTFLARAFDPKYNVQDSNNVQVSVQTLNFKTPIFDGVQTVENLSGKEGKSSFNVYWNLATPASSNGGAFSGNTDSISGYNIYVGESEESMVLYSTINSATTTTMKLSGLDSGKLYYIKVRAKNSDSPPVEDLNEKFIAKKTLTNIPISFAGVTAVTIPSSSAGFSNIDVKWAIGAGNYDRYKIYASSTPISSFNPQLADNLVDTITDLSILSRTINVASPNTIWYIAVVACNESACTESQGQNVIKYVKTSPPIAAFNGIKTIAQPAGGEGLSALELTWDLPDNNSGVYDEIRIFKSNASGHYDPFLDRVDNINYDINNPSVMGVTLKASSSVRVNGLTTGVEACFVAKAYSTTPFDASNPDGRTGLTVVVKCATPNYIVPGFAGVKPGCLNRTADAFKVSWNTPSPVGTYERYELYYKEGASGFDINAALTGDAAYTKKVVLSGNLNYTLSNLKLDTSYQILVKTHFHNPVNSTDYRDNNSIILTCLTTGLTVAQGPWFELFAIGPKYNAIKETFIGEKLTPVSGDSIQTAWKHQFPYEDNTGSANGIIRIAWEDMVLSNGKKLKEYYAIPNTGYKVYRMNYNAIYGVDGPGYDDPSWGVPVNTDYIQAPGTDHLLYNRSNAGYVTKTVAQFVDENLTHPYNDSISKANEGAVYWYKIEAWYNGKKLPLTSISSDAIVRMVLPPKNMSLVHRWMSNKQICEDMNQPIDRSNNYKCPYTGMGAVLDINDGQYYYDMKGDLLVDRFRMGCNFSRGNICSVAGGQSLPGFEGAVANVPNGVQVGDCISGNNATAANSEPQGKILAARGSVFFNRNGGKCYVNTSSSGTGTNWSSIQDLDEDHNVNSSHNMHSSFENYHDTEALGSFYHYNQATLGAGATKIPPYSTKYPSGLNYGAAYSSDAQLPPIHRYADPVSLYYLCQSSKVKINSINYEKRLARRKEAIVYKAESPLLNADTREKIENGLAEALPIASEDINFIDRDCDSNSINRVVTGSTASKYYTIGVTQADYYHNRYTATFGESLSESYKITDTLVTGSAINSKNKKSTEACVSRFGVQDYLGGITESTTDQFYCNQNDIPYGCFTGHKNYNKTVVFTPVIDPENKENYKSANGEYYSNLHSASSIAYYSSGIRIANPIDFSPSTSLPMKSNFLTDYFCAVGGYESTSCSGETLIESSKYFNLAMGLPMLCEGDTCQYNSTEDSNALVTTRSNAPSATTVITSFDTMVGTVSKSNTRFGFRNFNPGSYNNIKTLYSGADNAFIDASGRYSSVLGWRLNTRSGGRCVLLLPENY